MTDKNKQKSEVTPQILKCGCTWRHKKYNELYDSYFCDNCMIWLEQTCKDPKCSYCVHRPASPQKAKDIQGLPDFEAEKAIISKTEQKELLAAELPSKSWWERLHENDRFNLGIFIGAVLGIILFQILKFILSAR